MSQGICADAGAHAWRDRNLTALSPNPLKYLADECRSVRAQAPRNEEVDGSIPFSSTNRRRDLASPVLRTKP